MPLETVIPDAQIRTEPICDPVFATEAVCISGLRFRDLIDQLDARHGAVEAKERNAAVELRNTKGHLVTANKKVDVVRRGRSLSRWRTTSVGSSPSRDNAPFGPF